MTAWRQLFPPPRRFRRIGVEARGARFGSGLQTPDTHEEMAEGVRSGGIEGYYINRHNNDAGNRLPVELAAERLAAVARTR